MFRYGWLLSLLVCLTAAEGWAQPQPWQRDSLEFTHDWPEELVGRFINVSGVLPLPWGGMIATVQGIVYDEHIGIWLKDARGRWSHRYPFVVPEEINRSAWCPILASDSAANPLLVVGTCHGPYASFDSGRTWRPFNGVTPRQIEAGENPWFTTRGVLEVGGGEFWAADAFRGPAHTTNWGRTWRFIGRGLGHRNPAVFNTNDLFVDHRGQVWIQAEDGLYFLVQPEEQDSTWYWQRLEGIEYNLVDTSLNGYLLYCQPRLATFPDYRASTANGLMYLWSGWGLIWRSEDFGESWEQMTEPFPADYWPVVISGCIFVTMIVNEAGLVFLGPESGGLAVSADSADNWIPLGGFDFEADDDSAIANYAWWSRWIGGILWMDFDSEGYLFLGTSDGVIRSSIPINGPLGQPRPPNLVLPSQLIPIKPALSVFPNPFNDLVVISLILPVSGNTKLQIFDITGQQVAVLVNGWLSQGKYQFFWQPVNLPAGSYYVWLSNNQINKTQTLTLLK